MLRTSSYRPVLFVTAWMLAGTIAAVAQYSRGAQSLRKTSELYDERGNAQSKAVTVDGRLAVAPSNGGVAYTYPLATRTIHGFPITVTLNYAGSVSFSTYTNYDQGSISAPHARWARFSQNRPAWTIGVNGFAMQMLSFATSYHCDPMNMTLVSTSTRTGFGDSDFVWVADGYDVCNRMERLPLGNPDNSSIYTDVIRLLREDGSLLELVNTRTETSAEAENRADLYTGYYRVNEANARGFGIVEFDSTNWPNHIRRYAESVQRYDHPLYPFIPRRLRYFPGDGLEYRFSEWIAPYGLPAYADTHQRYGGMWAGPTIFYLEEIRSNSVVLTRARRSRHYAGTLDDRFGPRLDSTKGRALFTELENVCELLYSKRSIVVQAGGRSVQAVFDTISYSGSSGSRDELPLAKLGYLNQWSYGLAELDETRTPYRSFVGYVTKIIDPAGRATRFRYEPYRRRFRGFGFPVDGGLIEVALRNWRLVEIDEPTSRYEICYHTGDVRNPIVPGECSSTMSDEVMTFNTSTAGNPSALNNMARLVTKSDHDGTRLVSDEYAVDNVDATSGAFATATQRTHDHPAGTTRVVSYWYERHQLPPIHPFAPAPVYTELRTMREDAAGTTTITTTVHARPSPSMYLWTPLRTTVTVNGALRSIREFDYRADTVRRYGDDATLTAACGWEVTRAITRTFNPDSSLRLIDTVDYRHYPLVDTVVDRISRQWNKLASLQRFLALKNDLRDTVFSHRAWEEVMYDPRIAVFRLDTVHGPISRSPQFGVERRRIVADGEGDILTGRTLLLRGDSAPISDPGSPSVPIADSIVGRGGRALLREALVYGEDWTRNLPVVRIDANGARTLIAYDSLRDGIGGAQPLPRVGSRLTNDDSVRSEGLVGLEAELLEHPIAEVREVRKPTTRSASHVDTLVTETERSHFGQASAIRDANGWLTRSRFDRNGRLVATWLPGDYPRVGVLDTFYYEGADSIDLYGVTTHTRRIDTLRCLIERTTEPTYPRQVAEGTVPVVTSDPATLYAGLPVTLRQRCPCGDTATIAQLKERGSLMGDCSDTLTYEMTGAYPGYRGHLYFRVDRDGVLRSLVRADSALLRLYVANIEGECVSVRIGIPTLGFSSSWLFNCPSVPGNDTRRAREEERGLHLTQASVRRTRAVEGPYFDVPLDSVLTAIAAMQPDDTFSIEIRVTSPGTGIRFASSAAAADMRPKLIIFGRYRAVSDTVDYTLALRHVDDSLMTEVMAKTDDTKHTASRWTIDRYHGDIRRSRIRHFFGADFRQRFSQISIGEPAAPDRLDTVSFGHTGQGRRSLERDQEGDTVAHAHDGLGRVVETVYQDGSATSVEYRAGSPESCGIAAGGEDFGGFCSAIVTTDEAGMRRARYLDAFDRVRREVVALGQLDLTTRFDYDLLGRLIRVVNANGDTTRYWYDDFGRVRYKWQPDLGVVSYSYDNVGNVRFSQSTDQCANGQLTFTQYDDLGRVTLVGEATFTDDVARMTDTALRAAVNGRESLALGRPTDLLDPTRVHHGLGPDPDPSVNRSLYLAPPPLPQSRVWAYATQTIVPGGCQLQPTSILGERHDPDQPYLSHPIGYYNPMTQPAATFDDFENVALYPHFPRLAMAYDGLPDREGSIWSALPPNADWNAIAPRGTLRNLRGREAAVAWREHGGEPWHYAVFSYDERGRVEALLRYTENVGYDAVHYEYNALNQVTMVRVADPLNHHVSWYGYDRNGRLDTIRTLLRKGAGLGVGTLRRPLVPSRPDDPDVVFGYTRTGHVATMSYPPADVRVDYAYTARRWIDSLVAMSTAPGATGPLFRELIGYDPAGQMISRRTQFAGGAQTDHRYSYDPAQRLVQWYDGIYLDALQLDRIGNRRKEISDRVWLLTDHTYAAPQVGPNRLVRRQSWNARRDWERVDYTYDFDGAVAGRQRSDSSFVGIRMAPPETFTYSYRELLRRYTFGGATHDWRYRYSPAGEREQKRLYPMSLQNPSASDGNPWAYYLLGAAGEQLAVWHGREVYRSQCNGVPVGTAWMYPVEYKCLGGGLTRVSTRPDIAVPEGQREYYVADARGSTRLVVAVGGSVVEQIDYDPYGRPSTGPTAAQQTYVGRPRDLENGLGDHGVRKYEPAEGRFHSIDPQWESFRTVSPYQYAHGNPLNRVDANGQWDIVVHVAKDRSQNGYGVAVVTNRKGEEVFRFAVRVEGVGDRKEYGERTDSRNRLQHGSDTPLGMYDIPGGADKWRSDKADVFGPNPRLVLNELFGEVVDGKRSLIRIHGGRQSGSNARRSSSDLAKTHGCMRAYDNTMKMLKEVTDNLEAEDDEEEGGALHIIDDLVWHNGAWVPASDLKVDNGAR